MSAVEESYSEVYLSLIVSMTLSLWGGRNGKLTQCMKIQASPRNGKASSSVQADSGVLLGHVPTPSHGGTIPSGVVGSTGKGDVVGASKMKKKNSDYKEVSECSHAV